MLSGGTQRRALFYYQNQETNITHTPSENRTHDRRPYSHDGVLTLNIKIKLIKTFEHSCKFAIFHISRLLLLSATINYNMAFDVQLKYTKC